MKKLFHLPRIKMTVDFDGGVAGHDAQNTIPKRIHFPALAVDVDLIDDIEKQLLIVRSDEKRRDSLDHERAGTEVVDHKSEFVEIRQMLRKQCALGQTEFRLHRVRIAAGTTSAARPSGLSLVGERLGAAHDFRLPYPGA